MPSEYGHGLTEEDVKKAVLKSGYPLQTEIANDLKEEFFVQEEWSFLDKDSGSIRALDIVASKMLWNHDKAQPYVRPNLHLLIECKKSELPYVFFLSKGSVHTHDFPVISGLKENNIVITTDDDASRWNYSLIDLIGMIRSSFCSAPQSHCMTFSKCVRKGRDVILSGEEPYNSIVLPLIKSALHHIEVNRPPKTAAYFDCNIVIPIAVVDASLVGVVGDGDGTITEDLKWVRVYRHAYKDDVHKSGRETVYGCDIVKKEFLSEYLESHVLPFATRASELILKHHKVIATGTGFVPRMMNEPRIDIEPVLEEAKLSTAVSRYVLMWKNIINLISVAINRHNKSN